MERFVERFRYKATKARQAQSRVKKLDKMERIERDPSDTRSLGFSFGVAERTSRVVLQLEDGRLEVPGRTLLENGELWLERGEHVSLVGPNGAGKTTLIEALAGLRALDGGRSRTGHNVKLGYLSQHAEELGMRGTALEAAQRATGLAPEQGASAAGELPVLRGRGGEAARRAVGRRAPAPLAGRAGGLRGQTPWCWMSPPTTWTSTRARPSRTPCWLRRRGPAGFPRPCALDAVGHAHDRLRGRPPALL